MCQCEYDKNGKMKFNKEFHKNNGKKWSDEDVKYLIEWYDIIGAKEMSMALERTEFTVSNKVCELRRNGLMKKYTR